MNRKSEMSNDDRALREANSAELTEVNGGVTQIHVPSKDNLDVDPTQLSPGERWMNR
jgi:hypothetical protein